jgi:hypothetical protein
MNPYGLICPILAHLWAGCEKRESLHVTKNAACLVLGSDMGVSAPFSRNLHVFFLVLSAAQFLPNLGRNAYPLKATNPLGVLHRTCLTVAEATADDQDLLSANRAAT